MEVYNCFKMKRFWENYLNLLEDEHSDVSLFHILIIFVTQST